MPNIRQTLAENSVDLIHVSHVFQREGIRSKSCEIETARMGVGLSSNSTTRLIFQVEQTFAQSSDCSDWHNDSGCMNPQLLQASYRDHTGNVDDVVRRGSSGRLWERKVLRK